MAAAVTDSDRMVFRDLVEVVNIKRALVMHLGVVEEISLHPKSRGHFSSFRPELVDDAGDRDELDLIGVADQDLVEQYRSRRMIMGVDEPRHDRHLLGI